MRTVWMYDGVVYNSVDIAIVNGAKSRRDCLELEMNESESIEMDVDSNYLVLRDQEENVMNISLVVRSGFLSFGDEQTDELSVWYDFEKLLPPFSGELVQQMDRTIDLASDEL